jgi:putative ATP-binding cassette transporter
MDLKQELDNAHFSEGTTIVKDVSPTFTGISIDDLEFYYDLQNKAFGIGPISMDINQGDTIFIYGGNGSGKTTFVYTLLGLYTPTAGGILLNGAIVNHLNYAAYRSMFAVVFSNFFLFDDLACADNCDMEKFHRYLQMFELEGKVELQHGRFSTTDLSTGQRKRLALIAALMEEKPLLVLDEWAADQDPYFREKFYMDIVPLLKEEGITLIAITHDDKYYHCADKLFRMDYGKLRMERMVSRY